VQNPPYDLPIPEPPTNIAYYDEKYEVKVSNNYLALPILLRKYIGQKDLYLQGGVCAGYLLQSRMYVQQSKLAYIPNYEI
jgi:hypothetical protein